jgi:hypothetical protein
METELQVLNPDQLPSQSNSSRSMFTEPSYRNGSYLAPNNKSYSQLFGVKPANKRNRFDYLKSLEEAPSRYLEEDL